MRLAVKSGTAPLKRKADDGGGGPPPKVVRTDSNGVGQRPVLPVRAGSATARPNAPASGAVGQQKPTGRFTLSSNSPKTVQGAAAKPAQNAAPSAGPAPAKPAVKGFAAILQKAAAAAEAHKASASATIVHKPVEKLTRRDRERLKQEALEKQKGDKAGGRNGKLAVQAGRSRSGTPGDMKAGLPGKKVPIQIAYQGTMRKPPTAPVVSYKGTMRAADPAKPAKVQKTTDKYGGQDKYGGYASWSDLDDAEEEDEGDYNSESDMEGAFDEVEEEELASARLARKEDLAAQAEEEKLKQEKLARKQKLMALSKDARGKKKF
jgi:hypothetical protein